jgi:hypothetical protein
MSYGNNGEICVPERLEDSMYHYVGHFILTDLPQHGPPSASRLADIETGAFKPPLFHENIGLRRQINEVTHKDWLRDIEGVSAIPGGLEPTQGYVAVTTGTIALLDLLRGYHEAMGTPLPQLAGPDVTTPAWLELRDREHVSLLTHNAERNHEDARYIARQLFMHGVKQVTVLQGRCYLSPPPKEDIDTEALSSIHAERIRLFGQMCVWQ